MLRTENMSLRQVVQECLPEQASTILDKYTTAVSPMLAPDLGLEMKHELVDHDFQMIQVRE